MLLFDSGSDRVKQETQFYQSQHESLAAALTLINISEYCNSIHCFPFPSFFSTATKKRAEEEDNDMKALASWAI